MAGQTETRTMTVLQVRDTPAGAEVVFMESARIYRVGASDVAAAPWMALLRAAARQRRAVQVSLAGPDGELITQAGAPSP